MDFSSAGVTYAFLIIPSFFALIVTLQGVEKLTQGNKEGSVALGFGLVFFALIAGAYFFFIR